MGPREVALELYYKVTESSNPASELSTEPDPSLAVHHWKAVWVCLFVFLRQNPVM
jgi:hypothetical protein